MSRDELKDHFSKAICQEKQQQIQLLTGDPVQFLRKSHSTRTSGDGFPHFFLQLSLPQKSCCSQVKLPTVLQMILHYMNVYFPCLSNSFKCQTILMNHEGFCKQFEQDPISRAASCLWKKAQPSHASLWGWQVLIPDQDSKFPTTGSQYLVILQR